MNASLNRRRTAVPPRRPPEDPCPRLLVADHALVLCLPHPSTGVVRGLDDVAHAIYRLCAEQESEAAPLTAMEIAARLSCPRATTATHLSHLAYLGLVQLSSPHPSRAPYVLQEVLDALRA